MGGEAGAQGIVSWGEDSPPNGGAEHLCRKIALMARDWVLGRGCEAPERALYGRQEDKDVSKGRESSWS